MLAAETLPNLPDLTVEQAEHWIAAALAEALALRQHDDQLYPATHDPAVMRTAEQLHAAWGKWADAADGLYHRILPLLQAKRHVAGAHDLDYAIGRTRAMISITPQQMFARQEQVHRGETKTLQEVRRELRGAPRG